MIFNAYKDALLDKPSALSVFCVICGRPSTDKHHVIQKGMGGVKPELERRIPLVSLCRSCHKAVHAKTLHLQYDSGWKYYRSIEPMGDTRAWEEHAKEFRHIRVAKQPRVIGGDK